MASLPSTKLGPYELMRRLGAGGMAETYLALRRGPAGFVQEVCLKRVLPALGADHQFVQLFLEEARIQSRLRHGNIVQVYDFGVADGAYYLALELVDGIDLNGLLQYSEACGERLPIPVVLLIVRELCRALEVAHTLSIDGVPQQLVHRDISPSNILLSLGGEVKLTDFGIAKSENREFHTDTGLTRGKLGYMPPEQIQGHRLDARTDLFALGVVLYLMLSGEHPFRPAGASDYEILSRVVRGERKPLREVAGDAPAELVALTEALLASDPAARPGSARDIIERTSSLMPPSNADRQLAALVRAARKAREPSDDPAFVPWPALAAAAAGLAAEPAETVALPGRTIQSVATPLDRSSDEVSKQIAIPGRKSPARLVLLISVAFAFSVGGYALVRTAPARPAQTQPPSNPQPSVATAAAPPSEPTPPPEAPEAAAATHRIVLKGEPVPPQDPASVPAQPVTRAPESNAEETADNAAAAGSATLRVMLSPFGNVWIDGDRVGNAPVTRRLRAGVHLIEAGDADTRTAHTRVTLVAGETRTVRLRLDLNE